MSRTGLRSGGKTRTYGSEEKRPKKNLTNRSCGVGERWLFLMAHREFISGPYTTAAPSCTLTRGKTSSLSRAPHGSRPVRAITRYYMAVSTVKHGTASETEKMFHCATRPHEVLCEQVCLRVLV